MRAGPLMDHAGQAARFGAALRQAWMEWCAGEDRLSESSVAHLCHAQ